MFLLNTSVDALLISMLKHKGYEKSELRVHVITCYFSDKLINCVPLLKGIFVISGAHS